MAKMGLVSLASASTSSRVAAAIVVVLGLVLSLAVVCNGGKTSSFVRKVEKSGVMPLDSDVFKVPPGYNAPQQVHITQGDQLGKAVIVSWVTVDEPGSNTVVYWSAKGVKEMAEGEVTTYKFYNYTSGYIHHTIISNLNFDTKYHYEVGIDHTKRQFWFITPPEVGPDVPYTFGLIGDLGQTYDSNATLTHYELNPQKGQAVLYVGDLSYADLFPNHDNVRWDTWGRFTERSVAYQPWIWTAGNHDIDFAPEIGEPEPFKPYTHRYPVPHNASGSTSPLWYSIKRASAYIIVLSSYSAYGKYTPQNIWIEEELPKVNRSETSWLIVLMHSPWYNSYTNHYMEGETMRVMYESLFVKYKVDVVFNGHVHAYERSHRISNVAYNIVNGNCIPVKDQSAPVYLTIGDGGNSEGLATNMTEPQKYGPILYRLIPNRPLSTANSDPSRSKPLDSAEPAEPLSSESIPAVSTATSPYDSSQPIDAGSSIRKPISLWPGMYHSPVTNALWEARSKMYEKLGDTPIDAPSQSELVARTPAQSRTSILYKFSSDYKLREQYRNPWNEIRMGKLVEDLDALAGTIAYKHCCNEDGATRPLLLVTASVDKMVLKKPIRVDTDLNLGGAVAWVGKSSMEIQLEVTQSMHGTPHPSESIALIANFTFVARDSETGKSAPVNRISPETEKEKLLCEEADKRNKMRKKKRGAHKTDIENQDANRFNALLAEGRVFCDMPALADRDSILIRDTCLENSFICQPQQRNIHGRIFGGFLMRRAFELAFSTTYAFAGAAPHFLEVDHVDFVRPVDVGNFLRLKSCVLYTELENPAEPLINVEVVAHVTQPELRSSEVSNKFYFTFSAPPEAMKDGIRIRNVVPATVEEARRVIERMDAEEKSQFVAS